MEHTILKSIRTHYNMSQREFAKAINCSYSLIALIELGKRNVSANVEAKVKEKFKLTDNQISYINFLVEEVGKGMSPFI